MSVMAVPSVIVALTNVAKGVLGEEMGPTSRGDCSIDVTRYTVFFMGQLL